MFVKLDCNIVFKSIWAEDSDTCKVWITMLALANSDGVLEAAITGIASVAKVSLENTQIAIEKFLAPDKLSTNPDNDGRRIERIQEGFKILNYENYRQKDHTAAARMRKHREALRVTGVTLRPTYVSVSESVLSYLNLKTGKRYRNNKEILARLKDGYTEEQLKGIVDVKVCDPYFMENSQYLNPVTLFRKSHIDNYINQKPDEFKRKATNERIRPNEELTPYDQLMRQLESIDGEIMRTTRYLEQFDGMKDDELDDPTIEKIKAARITLAEQNAEFKETQKELELLLTKDKK